jgi:hypothetical protein
LRRRVALCSLILAIGAATTARAQSGKLPPIDTDRPDLTDGTGTVPRGHVQFESGYSRVTFRSGTSSYSVPELLMRFGIVGRFELRVGDSYESSPAPNGSGWTDLQLGTKIGLLPQVGNRPAISAEAFVSVPTGSDAVSAHRALPGAALLAQWDSPGDWTIGAEIQAQRGDEAGISWIPSLSIQFHPGDRLQFYGEFVSLQSTASAPPQEAYYNTGVLLRITDNLQADAHFSAGLNHAAASRILGFGLALRR